MNTVVFGELPDVAACARQSEAAASANSQSNVGFIDYSPARTTRLFFDYRSFFALPTEA
jgi:hypothetical protein